MQCHKVPKNSRRSKDIKYEIDHRGCHICISHSTTLQGYPQIQFNKKKTTVIRYLWEQRNGKIKKGLCIRHECDNKKCINLDHVLLGTNLDNIHDKIKRGRILRGERHQNSKLNWKAVEEIRKSNLSTIILAKKFGVSFNAVHQVRLGLTWLI